MASTMEQSGRRDESEFSLKEWAVKARISRENTNSRRFSASNIRSFREDARSFRSNATISSTASSPGYSLRDEIDPSTYSFTNALKALQARSGYPSWDCLSPDGFALNSKWNEAEKYICNPLSGEVPMECLSAKTLSGRSFRNSTNRITMSAPLVYSSHSRQTQTKPNSTSTQEASVLQLPILEKRTEGMMTRDVGTQSTPPDLSSSSPSPTSTPSIIERSIKRCGLEAGDSPISNAKIITEEPDINMVSLYKLGQLLMQKGEVGSACASEGERNKRYKRNKKRKGREKEERRAIMQQASWVLVMDEKEKAERETQSKKEQHLSNTFQRVLKENR